MDVEEFLRGLDEPPEVMRSMAAFLADRAGFDPATWDADQERAARATVVETHAGKVVPATRPHAARGERAGDVPVRPAGDRWQRSSRRSSRSSPPIDEAGSRARALASGVRRRESAAGRTRSARRRSATTATT